MTSVTVARSKEDRPSKAKSAKLRTAEVDDNDGDVEGSGPVPRPSLKRKRANEPLSEIEVDVSAPAPPSKKALRKSKRKPVTEPESSQPSAVKETTSDAADSEAPAKRSDYGVWIGNLSYLTTKLDVRRFLQEKGQVTEDEITRIHLPTLNPAKPRSGTPNAQKHAFQNKGFAYVDFTSAEALERTLALSETLLSGRKLLIKNAKSFEGRPKPSTTEPTHGPEKPAVNPNKKVFLGNLAFDTTSEDLTELLSQCGPLKKVHMATFEDSGKCKGYAWAEFETVEAAQAAVRGWIKVAKTEDAGSGEGANDGSESDQDGQTTKEKRVKKPRKRWVNRIKGRTLRVEFAEDDATRYKKRFGTRESSRAKRSGPSESNGADGTKWSARHARTDGEEKRERRFGRGVTRASAKRAREVWLQELEKQKAAAPGPDEPQKPSDKQPAVGTKIKFDE